MPKEKLNTYDVPYLRVAQPVGDFYISILPAKTLMDNVDILRRGISDEQRRNVQRKLNENRQKEIAAYVTDPDATFPTSIIVSLYDDAVTVIEEEKVLRFESNKKIGSVLDGQHRLEGLRLARELGETEIVDTFDLPVVFMIGLEPSDEAYIFSTINSKQKSVPSSLIFDLFGLRKERSPRKTCHEIAEALNADKKGPFYRGIKMLGTKTYDSEYLSQGTFAKELLALITKGKQTDEYERIEKKSDSSAVKADPTCPFNSFYIDGKDALIGKILTNYFGAISEVFNNEWYENPNAYVLRKSVGYTALMKVLKTVWQKEIATTKNASRESFIAVAKALRNSLRNQELTSENFGSSGSGADKLAAAMLENTKYGTVRKNNESDI